MSMGFVKMKLEGAGEVQRELEKLAKRAGIVGEDFADYSAGIAQRTVIRNVQPFGTGSKDYKPGLTKAGNPVKPSAKAKGELAVWKSLHNAFKVVPPNYRGADLVSNMAGAKSHHQSVRNKKGRVSRSATKKKIPYWLLQKYGRAVITRVGMAKGSLGAGGSRLGTKLPKWVKEHVKDGRASRTKGARGVVWQFDSALGYTSSDRVMGQKGVRAVLKVHQRVLRNSLRGKLRRAGMPVD